MVDTRTGTSTSPYTAEQDAKAAAILKERREKKEAKKKALIEEQAAKLKKIKEEMARDKERLKREEEEKLKAVEEEEEVEEQPLERRRAGGRGESSGTKEDQMEKKITGWVVGLSLGEEEEALMYVPREEQEAAMKEWDVEEDPLKRQAIEDEKKMEWKFRLTRERKRRMEAARQAAKELAEVKKQREQMATQVDLLGKMEIMARNIERLAQVQEEQYLFGRGQDIVVCSIRLGLRDFARELATQVGSEVKTKDRLILTLDEGGVDEVPYEQIEWGLEEEDSGVSQGRTYVAVAIGGRPQGGGRGQGQWGQASGGRSQGDQGVGGRGGNRQAGGRGQGPPQNRSGNRSPNRGVADELKERMPAWAKMKKESRGQLVLVDVEIFRGRVGALVDSGATRSCISRKALQKLKLGLKVQNLADPIVSILADNRTMRVEDYVAGVQAYFLLEKDGKVEKVIHSLTLLVEDSLPFDIVLGMDWGEAAGATLHLREHECRLSSPSGGVKTARLFHASGVDNSLAHCCLSAPAFARLAKKEQLEEQVSVPYIRPVTKPEEEKPIDPAIAKLLEEFTDLAKPPT
ncbi:hypothetical protein CBR_g32460 [Chara braunii]|uniref:Uncharacterized protein n=1 Tax=Chara braunii TaxID=69332 RepID=A0A388LGL5_CHABU|nr:hypothetical protein CBR_g32460 [Chara braunii]|eukprot:GBG81470.1 hypothetical protein CBR_g32460 [Chara braunii]